MNLSENEKQIILRHIHEEQPLPKEYIYKLFADDEDVFLGGTDGKKKLPIRFYLFILLNILTNQETKFPSKVIYSC